MSMSSRDFPAAVSPLITGRRGYQSGGATQPYALPNDIASALYGAVVPPDQEATTQEYPFLQDATGGTSMQPMAKGGAAHPRHDVTVVVPLGALARGAAPPATGGVHPLAQEMFSIVAQTRSLIARMKMTPGVNQQQYDAGAHLVEQGMLAIAASMPKPR